MKKTTTISKRRTDAKNQDYDYIYNVAIEYLQQMSGEIWTDYNLHDPGVTILEYLCYALTDIGYRTNLKVEDLLYAQTPNTETIEDTLFSPQTIYPSAPLTFIDYRKLLLDNFSEIQNCWIEEDTNSKGIKGLNAVYIQLNNWVISSPNNPESAKISRTKTKVYQFLARHRNLGEDFSRIEFLKEKKIGIIAQILIRYNSYAEVVLAKIFGALEEYFTAHIPRISEEELLKEGTPLDQILEGPPLQHGYIDSTHLKDRRREIHLREIHELLLNIKGVLNIENLRFQVNGIPKNKDVIFISDRCFPSFDKSFMHQPNLLIELNKEGRVVQVDINEVRRIFQNFLNERNHQLYHNLASTVSEHKSNLNRKDIAAYTSIQNFFPHIYGITKMGLPFRAPASQKNKAKQLKGYLILFEHFFSTYLANLSQLPHLFSISKEQPDCPFDYLPFDVPDIATLLVNANSESKIKKLYSGAFPIDSIKDVILNHLLARFNEEFPEKKIAAKELMYGDKKRALQAKIDNKKDFLRKYPELSSKRGLGLDRTQSSWETDNVSRLKKRISLLLGFPNFQNVSLTKRILEGRRVKKITKAERLDNETRHRVPMQNLLIYGNKKSVYTISKQDNNYKVYFNSPELDGQYLIYQSEQRINSERAIDNLRKEVEDIQLHSTGFFIVDHILLRSQKPQKQRFYLHDEDGKIILSGTQNIAEEEIDKLTYDFLYAGRHAVNYQIIKSDSDKYKIRLINEKKQSIMASPEEFLFDEVQSEIDKLRRLFLNLSRHPKQVNQFLLIKKENDKSSSNFHNFRLSFIFPAWTYLFFNREYRAYIQSIIIENIPAHLKPNFYWLSIQEMKQFEDLFRPWSTLAHSSDTAERDKLSIKLVDFLTSNKSR